MWGSRVTRNVTLIVFIVALAACTSNEQIRKSYGVCDWTHNPGACGTCDRNSGKDCTHVMERAGDVLLGFVEFDDQGWFWNRGQVDFLEQTLAEEVRRQQEGDSDKSGFLIFVYAHGWRHNATQCDNNVVCFRQLLRVFDRMEALEEKPRHVVGVYLGWRGLSTDGIDPWELASFWDRKNTAERVGSGALTEVLVRLNRFRQEYPTNGSHLILSGHSFGGQVMYRALSQFLIANAVGDSNSHAKGIGDLIVIVNPAYEGAQYQPLHDIATSRCYPKQQKPVKLTITSVADSATRTSFLLGRYFSTRLETYRPDLQQEQTDREAVGHLSKYRTAWLRSSQPAPVTRDRGACGCPYLSPSDINAGLLKNYMREVRAARRRFAKAYPKRFEQKEPMRGEDFKENYGAVELIPNPDYVPNFPYQMIYTDEATIPGHNEIFGEAFIDFLRRYYYVHIKRTNTSRPFCYRGGAPSEQSCRRAKGGICR